MAQQPVGFVPDRVVPEGFVPDAPATSEPASVLPAEHGDILWDNIRNIGSTISNWLPAIGGAAGGAAGSVAGPAGTVGGAALGAAAGEGYRQLMDFVRGKPSPSTRTEAVTRMGQQAVVQGALPAAVGAVATPVLRTAAESLMQGAVKPILPVIKKMGGTAAPLIKTLLNEGIEVTPGGVAKLQTILDTTSDQIADALSASHGRVQPLRVASRLADTAKKFTNQVNPAADLQAISDAGQQFLEHPALTEADMSVQQAQRMKVGTYQQIRKSYGQLSNASVEAQKALARGLKEEIAKEVPSIAPLNIKEGQILQALDAVGRRVALSGNRDPIGFAWVTHNPTTFLAALLDRSPGAKSWLARGLYDVAGTVGHVSPQLIRVAVTALASASDPTTQDSSPNTDRPQAAADQSPAFGTTAGIPSGPARQTGR